MRAHITVSCKDDAPCVESTDKGDTSQELRDFWLSKTFAFETTLCLQPPLSSAPCCSPSVSDGRVLLQGGAECGDLLRQPLHHRVLQLGLVGAVETVEGICVVQRVHLHTYKTWTQSQPCVSQNSFVAFPLSASFFFLCSLNLCVCDVMLLKRLPCVKYSRSLWSGSMLSGCKKQL